MFRTPGSLAAAFVLGVCSMQGAPAQTAPVTSPGMAAPWSLHSGDRVVFYGDSITEQRFFTWWAELYAVTRFPAQHVRFWNAGVGGDRVTGGGGGPVDERLARDVFPHKPTVVTVMLGMNDGSYTPLTPAIEARYTAGYEHILTSLTANAPGVRLFPIGPSPYDDVTRPPDVGTGYNGTLVAFARDDKALAAKFGSTFVDANTPFVAALTQATAIDSQAAQLLVPDRVHPQIAAHLLIAAALLDAWHAPSLVAETALDAASATVLPATERTAVSELRVVDSGLQWTSLEEALPMPLIESHADSALINRVTDFTNRFNREPLLVQHLPAGNYRLLIDDADVGTFSSTELGTGVNLAERDTPMRKQAQAVQWIIRDKGDLQYVRTRIAIARASPEAGPALDKAEQQLQESIWRGATPVPHHFLLTRVAP